jgi:hypothetical protein
MKRKLLILIAFLSPAVAQQVWRVPPDITLTPAAAGEFRLHSTNDADFDLLSTTTFPARPGDVFELNVRIKVDLHTRALPDLACYDAAGKELKGRSVLDDGPSTSTTNWQTFRRVLPVLPGTASVRARIRASGRGDFGIGNLDFRPSRVDSYTTGALITQI